MQTTTLVLGKLPRFSGWNLGQTTHQSSTHTSCLQPCRSGAHPALRSRATLTAIRSIEIRPCIHKRRNGIRAHFVRPFGNYYEQRKGSSSAAFYPPPPAANTHHHRSTNWTVKPRLIDSHFISSRQRKRHTHRAHRPHVFASLHKFRSRLPELPSTSCCLQSASSALNLLDLLIPKASIFQQLH